MNDVFLDTVGLVATWDQRDQWHPAPSVVPRDAPARHHRGVHKRQALSSRRLHAALLIRRLWIFHHEFVVWMLVEDYREIVSSTVQRLGVMARAASIFLGFAAQRPEDRVMPVQLRDYLGNCLVLRVESPGTSMIAPSPCPLPERGNLLAERLLGGGRLPA